MARFLRVVLMHSQARISIRQEYASQATRTRICFHHPHCSIPLLGHNYTLPSTIHNVNHWRSYHKTGQRYMDGHMYLIIQIILVLVSGHCRPSSLKQRPVPENMGCFSTHSGTVREVVGRCERLIPSASLNEWVCHELEYPVWMAMYQLSAKILFMQN